jgi:hypothetical protein
MDALSCQKPVLLGVLRIPPWRAVASLLFRPDRGLFFLCPLAVLMMGGWMKSFSPALRPVRFFSLLTFAVYLAVIASFPGWHGGGSPGPRYLLTPLPFFFLGLGWIRRGPLFYGLTIAGILISAAIAVLPTDYYSISPAENIFRDGVFPAFQNTSTVLLFVAVVLAVFALLIASYRSEKRYP